MAHYFLYTYARELNVDVRGFAPEVLEWFQLYPWPGNVRELQGAIKEAILRSSGQLILPEFLAEELRGVVSSAPEAATGAVGGEFDLGQQIEAYLQDGQRNVHGRIMQAVERELLVRALRFTKGHQAQASDLLGINRTTLRSKLRELGITLEKVLSDRSDGSDEG